MANSTELLVLKEITENLPFQPSGNLDNINWLLSSTGRFTTKSAWEHIRVAKPQVPWKHIVWYSGNLPKASFILWLAVRRKLGTQDRLHNVPHGTTCLLCNAQLETHDHLFFECQYSCHLWHIISLKGAFNTPSSTWGNLVEWISSRWKGKNLLIKSWKLCLSITIYHLWRETNRRFHTPRYMSVQETFGSIVEEIRLKLSTQRQIRDSPQNRAVQLAWMLPDTIFSNL